MSKIVCPCGMPLHLTTDSGTPAVMPYSVDWHIQHQRRHLRTFPDCDVRTRNNLDSAVKRGLDAQRAVRVEMD